MTQPIHETAEPRAAAGGAQHATMDPLVALEAEHISKAYRRGWRKAENRVLTNADLTIRSGEVVGLVGENGSGKSTLMKILVGSLDSDGGRVDIRGAFGYCPQEPILYERLTCDEHFELFGEAYGLNRGEIQSSRDNIYDVLGFVGYRDTRVEELSGGTKAKLNLGLALLHDPDVLLLDEPYAGFDWDTYLRFWELTGQRRDAGRAVLIISHFVADAERFDRIVHLSDGRTDQ
jgi:ABC-type multidrug transport system ATPase subunit